jgi:hypothetical protein
MAKIFETEEALNRLIIEAYTVGLSVIEISFVLNRTSADYVHNLLRSRGYIDPFPANTRRVYEADRALLAALQGKRYSFAKWAVGWGFKPADAELELTEKRDGKVKGAIRRDFPKIFERLYGEKADRLVVVAGRFPYKRPSFLTVWDVAKKEYICSLLDDPNITSSGCDAEEAVSHFLGAYRSINRSKCMAEIIRKFKETGSETC